MSEGSFYSEENSAVGFFFVKKAAATVDCVKMGGFKHVVYATSVHHSDDFLVVWKLRYTYTMKLSV